MCSTEQHSCDIFVEKCITSPTEQRSCDILISVIINGKINIQHVYIQDNIDNFTVCGLCVVGQSTAKRKLSLGIEAIA
jgi:hypothetical protein